MDSLSISLALKDEDGKLVEVVSAVFTESEIELLRRFVVFVDRLRGASLLQRGMPGITNLSMTPEFGMKFTCPAYENGELHEFKNISGTLGIRFENENVRAYLKRLRIIFEDGELKLYMQISLNDQPLFDDSTLKLWLYGEQYHTEEEKATAWKDLENSITAENARALVITQLQAKVKVLFDLQRISNLVLEKYDSQTASAN